MTKVISNSRRLENAARLAILLLPIGSAERIELGRALNACAKPKETRAVSGKAHKYHLVCAVAHDGHCYCEMCAPKRYLEAEQKTAELRAQGYDFTPVKLIRGTFFNKAATTAALDRCACGHVSSAHAKDELENLLKCSGTLCDCDHFHYQTEIQETAAAAG